MRSSEESPMTFFFPRDFFPLGESRDANISPPPPQNNNGKVSNGAAAGRGRNGGVHYDLRSLGGKYLKH